MFMVTRKKLNTEQLDLFRKTKKKTTRSRSAKRRLSETTIIGRELAKKLNEKGLICATLTDKIHGKKINVITEVGKQIEVLLKTPGFNLKKFIKDSHQEYDKNTKKLESLLLECCQYKLESETEKKVLSAIKVISYFAELSAQARGWQITFVDVSGKQHKQDFERKSRD